MFTEMKLSYVVFLALLALSGAQQGQSQVPEDAKDELTDDEESLCIDLHYPAVFKQCLLGGHTGFLRSLDQCARDLDLVLPCQLEWITKDTNAESYNCTGRMMHDQDFGNEADKKCLDGCIAKRLGLLTEDGKPDIDTCISFLEVLPVFQNQPMSVDEKTKLQSALDDEISDDPRFSENDTNPTCMMGSRIILGLWTAALSRGLETCIPRLCKEKLNSSQQ